MEIESRGRLSRAEEITVHAHSRETSLGRKYRQFRSGSSEVPGHSITEGLSRVSAELVGIDRSHTEGQLPVDEEEESDNAATEVDDVLIENQRGWFFFGYPFFSSNSLMPKLDPPGWTASDGKTAVYGDPSTYLLPDITWEWRWKRWYVDMSRDVDDQGWAYSWRFGSSSWHGTHRWLHSFVRKRVWKRLRRKIAVDDKALLLARPAVPELLFHRTVDETSETTKEPSAHMNIHELLAKLHHSRLDRERIGHIVDFASRSENDQVLEIAPQFVDQWVEALEFDKSKVYLEDRLQDITADNATHRELLDKLIAALKHSNRRNNIPNQPTADPAKDSPTSSDPFTKGHTPGTSKGP